MERMLESRDIKHMACVERIKQLEEENKKLNEEIQRFKDNAMQDMREITELEIENKTLNEKVRFLEECLDRKEKLNEKYRKELKNYVYDAKQVRDVC